MMCESGRDRDEPLANRHLPDCGLGSYPLAFSAPFAVRLR